MIIISKRRLAEATSAYRYLILVEVIFSLFFNVMGYLLFVMLDSIFTYNSILVSY
jgi:hypothetical protein